MIFILLFHAKIHFGLGFHNVVIDEIVSIGAVGVVGFFMISGFCLRNNYRELRYFMGGWLKKRIAGIYPSCFFLLCCSLIFRYRVEDSWMNVIKILPMELSLFHVTINPLLHGYFFNDNFWYISALFVLYLLFPYFNEAMNHISAKKKWILCVILPVISWYIYYLNIYISSGNVFLLYYTNPLFRIPEFLVGMLAADIAPEINKRFRWWHVTGIIVLTIAVVHCIYPYWVTLYNLYNLIIIPCFFLLLLAAGTMNEDTFGFRLAGSRWMKYIASLGLSMYLCQSLSIMVIERNYLNISDNINLVFIILSIIFAVLLHEIVEKPGKRLLLGMKKGKRLNESE